MSNMSLSDSDLSSLSSVPSTDDESVAMAVDEPKPKITKYFKKAPPAQKRRSPSPPRAPSPEHEYVLADNPDIAFIVMFRARFSDVFPRSLPHLGPQDIERGVTDIVPGDHIERLLCALIGLVLNRKKDVERGHYQRALEEAVQTNASQWPRSWQGKNPLHGGRTFATMSPEERLGLLKALILWALNSSDAVQAKIKESYLKQSRQSGDLNQPLSVQPWGRDGSKRRYWLIEGQDDTHFRLYRESDPYKKPEEIHWWSVAGNIPELKAFADNLAQEDSTYSNKLSEKIKNAIPRFEGSEEKRKRRDYRLARKAAFARPEPGFSLYEGRTRGKKLKYTYSDDEDFSDGLPATRRSTRNTSGVSSPAEPAGPTFTASGRQVRSRVGGIYGESMLSGQRRDDAASAAPHTGVSETGRPLRSRAGTRANGYHVDYNSGDEMEDESEGAPSSGNEWQAGDEEDEDDLENENEELSKEDESVLEGEQEENPSLVVQLRYGKGKKSSSPNAPSEPAAGKVPVAKETANGLQNLSPKSTEGPEADRPTEPEQKPPMAETSSSTSNIAPPRHHEDAKENVPNGLNSFIEQKPNDSDIKVVPGQPAAESNISGSQNGTQ
ncbi:hypothetical protein VTN00DRAFT_1107 [Thermoascus crustaceus]|uniref:uncharacterized protein n=1 Tax=Thermoascus crustaceus TaxID=5088 RepID=UPI00374379FF